MLLFICFCGCLLLLVNECGANEAVDWPEGGSIGYQNVEVSELN